MSDQSHAFAIQPLVDLLFPIISSVVVALIGVLGTWIAPTINRWFHIKLDQAQIDTIIAKAQTVAGQLIAADEKNLVGKSITIDNPKVLAAATSIAAKVPAAMAIAGWDSDRIAKLIVGEIGKLQALQLQPPAIVVTPTPVVEVAK